MKRFTWLTLAIGLLVILAAVVPACATATPTPVPSPAVPFATATPTPDGVPVLTSKPRLKVATTTSLYDTGLWSYLEPMFEKKYNMELDVIYAASGKAIQLGQTGDVDILTVHSKDAELKFIADGYGKDRTPFAYNHFLLVGPASDPAGIKGLPPEDAFRKMKDAGMADGQKVKFVSRGDNSGTHVGEQAIWKSAGIDYAAVRKSGAWYIEAGNGMGPTLVMASEKGAYTYTDIGTFLAYKSKLDLTPIVDKGAILLNVYCVDTINPDKVKGTNTDGAQKLKEFLLSSETQRLIGDYGVKEYGMQLFTPSANVEPKE